MPGDAIRIAREAMSYTHDGFKQLSEEGQEELGSLVPKALEEGPLAGIWDRTKAEWIAVVGPFDNPKIVAEGQMLDWHTERRQIELSNQNGVLRVWMLYRRPDVVPPTL